jgi:hypothetical protein
VWIRESVRLGRMRGSVESTLMDDVDGRRGVR